MVSRGTLLHHILLCIFLAAFDLVPLFAQDFVEAPALANASEQFRGEYAVVQEGLSIWNGEAYVPVFVKGINLGVSVPGTQPGELAASREDYRRWFGLIREAGFNTIRLYTLHYPRFYEELRTFNLENPREPLLVVQGIWLEEQEQALDLYGLTEGFDQEIREVVSAAHGDISIDHRFGKAYGSFTADISPWVLAWMPGREIFPEEVALTNAAHPEVTGYSGERYSLPEGEATEAWIAERIDLLAGHEFSNYGKSRPVGFSTWPTLDPLEHPTEARLPGSGEDLEQIDLANMEWSEASGGFFLAYHAYPYYPDFIVQDPVYNMAADDWGPNNYLGYLLDLKSHYAGIPVLVGEFGVPSSWGSGHHSPSGMHHGAMSEKQQGEFALRMFGNLREAGFAGGMQFSLIDEWFKQTWITNPFSDAAYRHHWHNITSPEQNFGILTYMPPPEGFETTGRWEGKAISKSQAYADYTFFRIRLFLNTEEARDDTLWIALDTYEKGLGGSRLPDGRSIGGPSDTLRSEFLLRIPVGGEEADLFVQPAYDTYGVRDLVRSDTVVSLSTDQAAWNLVRWKNNYYYDQTQYIGNLRISGRDDPYQFLHAISRYRDSLEIRLPWTLINFTAPSVRRVMHYLGSKQGEEIVVEQRDSLSQGIAFSLVHRDELYQSSRYSWSFWDHEKIFSEEHAPLERKKESYFLLREGLPEFNSLPLARADSFHVEPGEILRRNAEEGIMQNDLDIDGNPLEVKLAFGNGTAHGDLALHPDGSFVYTPDPGFRGEDDFYYYLDDGRAESKLARVELQVNYPVSTDRPLAGPTRIWPNPASDHLWLQIDRPFHSAQLRGYDLTGREVLSASLDQGLQRIDVQGYKAGVYLFILTIDQIQEQFRILLR